MAEMKLQIDAKDFQPVELTAPDGRPFTATTLSEYKDLITSGYAVTRTADADGGEVPADGDNAAVAPDARVAPETAPAAPRAPRAGKPAAAKPEAAGEAQ